MSFIPGPVKWLLDYVTPSVWRVWSFKANPRIAFSRQWKAGNQQRDLGLLGWLL